MARSGGRRPPGDRPPGSRGTAALAHALGSPHVEVRRAAVQGFVALGPGAEGKLGAVLAQGNLRARLAAVEALGRLGARKALERVAGRPASRGRAAGLVTAIATAYLGDARAVPPLVRALDDDERDVRLAAAGALGHLGAAAARVLPRLQELLDIAIPKQWGWIGDADAVPVYRGAIEEIRRALRRAPAELEAASAPGGRGTELEAAAAPEGRGTELEAGADGEEGTGCAPSGG